MHERTHLRVRSIGSQEWLESAHSLRLNYLMHLPVMTVGVLRKMCEQENKLTGRVNNATLSAEYSWGGVGCNGLVGIKIL